MKLLLTAICLSFCLSMFAQPEEGNTSKLLKEYQLRKRFNSGLQFQKPIDRDSLIKEFKDFYSRRKEPGIYYLPQDHMPCLVPDTKDLAAIPNAWPAVQVPFPSNIPNPGLQEKPLIDKPKDRSK